MSGVFLSYSRSDRAMADQVIRGLRALGVTVWWDEDMPGVDWQQELERQVSDLAAVVVIWTPMSTASKNVRDEARLSLSSDKLINVLFGVSQPPFPFDRVNALPMDGWTGREPHKGWSRLVQTVEQHLVATGAMKPGALTATLTAWEADLAGRNKALNAAQDAFQAAQIEDARAADLAKDARSASRAAEEEQRRLISMRASAPVVRAAQQQLDAAREALEAAEASRRITATALSEASRAVGRAKADIEALMPNATPIVRPPPPARKREDAKASVAPLAWAAIGFVAMLVLVLGGYMLLHHAPASAATASGQAATSANGADAPQGANAQTLPLQGNDALSGVWHGTYSYTDGRPPVNFIIDLRFNGNAITGQVGETNTFGQSNAAFLNANLRGQINGDQIQFYKTYDGAGGASHTVFYQGYVNRANHQITGQWKVQNVSGDFVVTLQR